MIKFVRDFSVGEVGFLDLFKTCPDRSAKTVVCENFLLNDNMHLASRGGSKLIDTIDGSNILELVSFRNYTLIKFKSDIRIYRDDVMIYRLSYEGNFNISCMIADYVPSATQNYYKLNGSDVCNVGFGLYRKENFNRANIDNNVFVDIENVYIWPYGGAKPITIIPTANCFVYITKDNIGWSVKNVAFPKTGDQATVGQVLAIDFFGGQIIGLTMCGVGYEKPTNYKMMSHFGSYRDIPSLRASTQTNKFKQILGFDLVTSKNGGGGASTSFLFDINIKAQYRSFETYKRGFVIYGDFNCSKYYSSTEYSDGTTIFQPENIKMEELLKVAIQDVDCFDMFLIIIPKTPGRNKVYLFHLGYSDNSARSAPYFAHATVSDIVSVEALETYPRKFVILYSDGTCDLLYIFEADNQQYNYVNTRLTFYGAIQKTVGSYSNYFRFIIDDQYQVLDLDSQVGLDAYKEYDKNAPVPIYWGYPFVTDAQQLLGNYYQIRTSYNGITYYFRTDIPTTDIKIDSDIINNHTYVVYNMVNMSYRNVGNGSYEKNILVDFDLKYLKIIFDRSAILPGRKVLLEVNFNLDTNYYLKSSNYKRPIEMDVWVFFDGDKEETARLKINNGNGGQLFFGKKKFLITKETAVVYDEGILGRSASGVSSSDKYFRDETGKLIVNYDYYKDLKGHVGYLIGYNLVFTDLNLQGTSVYGYENTSPRLIMLASCPYEFIGKATYVNVNADYFDCSNAVYSTLQIIDSKDNSYDYAYRLRPIVLDLDLHSGPVVVRESDYEFTYYSVSTTEYISVSCVISDLSQKQNF